MNKLFALSIGACFLLHVPIPAWPEAAPAGKAGLDCLHCEAGSVQGFGMTTGSCYVLTLTVTGETNADCQVINHCKGVEQCKFDVFVEWEVEAGCSPGTGEWCIQQTAPVEEDPECSDTGSYSSDGDNTPVEKVPCGFTHKVEGTLEGTAGMSTDSVDLTCGDCLVS